MSDSRSREKAVDVVELWEQLWDLENGQLDPAARDDLMALLDESRAARRLYSEYFAHSVALEREAGYLGQPESRAFTGDSPRVRQVLRLSLVAAAAAIALAAAVMTFIITRTPTPMLSIATSPGTVIDVNHQLAGEDAPKSGTMEPGSRIELVRGTAELDFSSGVRGIILAPADLTLRAEDLLELDHGTAWFEVPSKAVGFQVNTPDLLLVDLGTEFGIRSRPDIPDEVHVFTGRVEVLNRLGLKEQELVTGGQARVAGPAGRWVEIPLRRDHFLTELPETEPESTMVFSDSFESAKALGGWRVNKVPTAPTPGGSTASIPAHWVKEGNFASYWINPREFTDPNPDGDIGLYANGKGSVSRKLPDTLQPNTTYTLTVATGWRAATSQRFPTYPGYGIELWAGGNLLASNYDKRNGGAGTGPAAGTWKDVEAIYTTSSEVEPGQQLKIRLMGYSQQTNYDHVRLEASPVR